MRTLALRPITPTLAVAIFVLSLSQLALAQAPATQPAPPAVGDKLSDFKLNRLDGKAIQLAELTKQGPVIILMLRGWVGYQCPICNRQVGDFITSADKFKAAGANVVMIYPGPADSVQGKAEDFTTGKTLPEGFHFVVDPDLKIVNQYHLRWDAPRETAYPSTFVVNKEGVVTFAKISKTHGDRSSADDVLKLLPRP